MDRGAEAIWEQLRATRWNPPTTANTTRARRATYVFALEQAEQMFRAAATVGPATRPLLIFYGLSQAGRAIAAAAAHIDDGDRWNLKGHGITSTKLDRELPEIEIRTGSLGENGSFVRLSEVLKSPLWGKAPICLNELWDQIPENERKPLLETELRRTPLWVEHHDLHEQRHPLASVPVVGFPPRLLNSDNGREALDSYLEAFPEAKGYHDFLRVNLQPDGDPAFDRHTDGWGELLMHWRLPSGRPGTIEERLALLESITRPYKGRLYFFPVVTPCQRSIHPLMIWWATLHALSMLARYQPAEWASHINIDASRYAVAIERLLKDAIRSLPELIMETIDQVADHAEN